MGGKGTENGRTIIWNPEWFHRKDLPIAMNWRLVSHQNSYVEILVPNMMMLVGKRIRSWGRDRMWFMPSERANRKIPCPFSHVRIQREIFIWEEGCHLTMHTSRSRLSASRTERGKCLSFIILVVVLDLCSWVQKKKNSEPRTVAQEIYLTF